MLLTVLLHCLCHSDSGDVLRLKRMVVIIITVVVIDENELR